MIRGILYVVVYYGIAFGIAGVVYLVIGNQNAQVLGLHHFIIMLALLGGFFWFMSLVKKIWLGQLNDQRKGTMIAHGIIWLVFVVVMYWLVANG